MIPAFTFQVYGFDSPSDKVGDWANRIAPLATFFEYGDAVTFAGQQDRSAHIATIRDRRSRGYRPATHAIEPARMVLTDRARMGRAG